MEFIILLIVLLIAIFIFTYRNNSGEKTYKYVSKNTDNILGKYNKYSFKEVRKKVKELGQDYTKKQYLIQITIFAAGSAVVTYLYFYNLIISIFYVFIAISFVPYLAYLRERTWLYDELQ